MSSKAKICSRCRKRKPLDAFYQQKGGAQGRGGACKVCFRAAERAPLARDPKARARRREIVERWRNQGLGL